MKLSHVVCIVLQLGAHALSAELHDTARPIGELRIHPTAVMNSDIDSPIVESFVIARKDFSDESSETRVLSVGRDRVVRESLFTLHDGKPEASPTLVALIADGKHVYCRASRDGTRVAVIINSMQRERVVVLDLWGSSSEIKGSDLGGSVCDLVVSPKGNYLALTTAEQVSMYAIKQRGAEVERMWRIPADAKWTTRRLAFSTSGESLLVSDAEYTRILDAETGKRQFVHKELGTIVASQGEYLYILSENVAKLTRIHTVKGSKQTLKLSSVAKTLGHPFWTANAVTVSPDGKSVAIASLFGIVVFDVDMEFQKATKPSLLLDFSEEDNEEFTEVAYSHDGEVIFGNSPSSRGIRVWKTPGATQTKRHGGKRNQHSPLTTDTLKRVATKRIAAAGGSGDGDSSYSGDSMIGAVNVL